MSLLILTPEDTATQQKISHIFISPLNVVYFLWDVGKDPLGETPKIIAPLPCVQELIEEIEKGEKENCFAENPLIP